MRGQTHKGILKNKLQRVLRNHPTEAEAKLWRHLRLAQLGGCKFRRQHPYYNAVLDFVCLEHKLVVEVDGSQHAESSNDLERDARLQRDGFRVLRFWNNEVLRDCDNVLNRIHTALRLTPQPVHIDHAKDSLQ